MYALVAKISRASHSSQYLYRLVSAKLKNHPATRCVAGWFFNLALTPADHADLTQKVAEKYNSLITKSLGGQTSGYPCHSRAGGNPGLYFLKIEN